MSPESRVVWVPCPTLLRRDTAPEIPAEGSLEGPGLPGASTFQTLI